MIYLTSDLHLNHNRDFVWKARGFSSVDEMNKEIVRRWNEVVSDNDIVYVLGDTMLNDDETTVDYLKQLKGDIHFLFGNHDSPRRIAIYESLGWTNEGYVKVIKYKKYNFYLSHYPTLTSNLDEDKPLKQKMINLYGHTHQIQPINPDMGGVAYNVGMDANDCCPIVIDDVIDALNNEIKNLTLS